MSFLQKFNIDSLRTEFDSILQLFQEIQNKKTEIIHKLDNLKEIYNKLIKENNKKIFLFCLDSFYFQYKTLNIELDNILRFIALINNRMYGDYYKLYNIIILQCTQLNIDTRDVAVDAKKYQPYRDLEQFHEYDLEQIIILHKDILGIITQLLVYSVAKEQKINTYTGDNNIGISILNFINTLEYENTLLREQVTLYVNYVGFFHNSHTAYLQKLNHKIQQFYTEIEDDIINNSSGKTRLKINVCNGLSTTTSNSEYMDLHIQSVAPLNLSNGDNNENTGNSATSGAKIQSFFNSPFIEAATVVPSLDVQPVENAQSAISIVAVDEHVVVVASSNITDTK